MSKLFSRLLLATEHSEYDTGAEAMAFELARHCQLPLAAVLPLASNPEYETLAPQIAARAEREAALKIAQIRTQAHALDVAIDVQVRRGEEAYQEIVAEARARDTELIIIRRRGKRGFLANLLVGEMVSKVVTHAPCHVLIVPRDARMWRQQVMVAAEPGAQGLQLVSAAAAVASECGLPLHIVCIAGETPRPSAEAFVAQALQLARQSGVSAQAEVRAGKVFSEILAAGAACGADLLVIGSRSGPAIGRALIGGVAQKIIGLSDKPVLVLNPEATRNPPHHE